uniref:RING-type E3 ubiquitin transferase (cysteine targeting) n=1 Tax=Cacopsylla melanoneura TaxID=428564 RepID=A0A8D8YZT1_9HEMI
MTEDTASLPPQQLPEHIASRVTIFDSHEINDDLTQLIRSQLNQVLKYFPSWVLTKYNNEVNGLLNLFLQQQSILTQQSSFVQHMFQLKYADSSVGSSYKLTGFVLTRVLADYIKRKSDEISIYLRAQHSGAYLTYKYLDIVLDVFKVANFLLFLNRGVYYTLAERCFQLKLVSKTRAPRSIEYHYLSRELLYQSLTELLVALMPLLQSPLLIRKLTHWFSAKQTEHCTKKEVPVLNLHSKCNGCIQFPWQPYHIECKHVYCYYCLVTNCKLSDDKYECCICFHVSDTIHGFTTEPLDPDL